MPEYARKASIQYCDFSLDMFQLPNGDIKPCLTQASATLEKHHKSFKEWALGKSPEALEYRKLIVGELIKENEDTNPSILDTVAILSDEEIFNLGIQTINFGEGCLIAKLISLDGLLLYWAYWKRKENILAGAYLAAGTKETIMRRAYQAFGIIKTEKEYQQQTTQDFYNFKALLETYLVPIQNELQIVRENQLKIAPLVEAGKVIMSIYQYFPNYEKLLAEVASVFDSIVIHNYSHLKDCLYSLGFRDVSHGERINIAKMVCGFSSLGNSNWVIQETPKGRKKYSEALLPIIKEATLIEFSKRNNIRLIK